MSTFTSAITLRTCCACIIVTLGVALAIPTADQDSWVEHGKAEDVRAEDCAPSGEGCAASTSASSALEDDWVEHSPANGGDLEAASENEDDADWITSYAITKGRSSRQPGLGTPIPHPGKVIKMAVMCEKDVSDFVTFKITFGDANKYKVDNIVDFSTIVSKKYAVVWVIISNFPDSDVTHLKDYLDIGGRIVFVGENAEFFAKENARITSAVKTLGGGVEIRTIMGDGGAPQKCTESNGRRNCRSVADDLEGPTELNNVELTRGVTSISSNYWASLRVDKSVCEIVAVTTYQDRNQIWGADQFLSKGRITIWADVDAFMVQDDLYQRNANFFRNLVHQGQKHVDDVDNGEDPNEHGVDVSPAPTGAPSTAPTAAPTKAPTTRAPTHSPTTAPSTAPTAAPTKAPSEAPTTRAPTHSPTTAPSTAPTAAPTKVPTTSAPTHSPTKVPTEANHRSAETPSPTEAPTEAGTKSPTIHKGGKKSSGGGTMLIIIVVSSVAGLILLCCLLMYVCGGEKHHTDFVVDGSEDLEAKDENDPNAALAEKAREGQIIHSRDSDE